MISNRHITKVIAVIVTVAVVLCLGAIAFSNELSAMIDTGVTMQYESELFDTDSIISLNILMDEDDWQDMLDNAADEEYHTCDVTINGTTFYNVAIRTKGNTSLSSIASDPDSNRYSFKLEFDRYVENQTCFGLDKLILNNNFADATNMKEAIIYDMFEFLDADASLYNYAQISVNGGYWGVYLALEAVEDSFLLRHYGTQSGELYKPDSMQMGENMGGGRNNSDGENGFTMPDKNDFEDGNFSWNPSSDTGTGDTSDTQTEPNATPPANSDGTTPENGFPSGFDTSQLPEGMTFPEDDFDFSEMGGGMNGGGFSMSGGGSDLNYTDDSLDSYSTIWEGAVTKTTDSDHQRVVTALKNISEATDIADYMDVDNLLKYMAVHVFSVNLDSLSGSMAHNYYLYESGGVLNMLPWDYNLSFGGMGMGNSSASDMINDAIDDSFQSTAFFDALLENEEYLATYHSYLDKLIRAYVKGGVFDDVYTRIRNQIDSLVETDPNASYTYDEYDAAAQMLYATINLRADSIAGQLDGSIPSTSEGQKADATILIDASAIDISVMGTFSNGGFSMGNDENGGQNRFGGNRAASDGTAMPSENGTMTASSTTETRRPVSDSTDTNSDLSGAMPSGENTFPSGSMNGSTPPSGSMDGGSFPSGAMTGNAPPSGTTGGTAGGASDGMPSDGSGDPSGEPAVTDSENNPSSSADDDSTVASGEPSTDTVQTQDTVPTPETTPSENNNFPDNGDSAAANPSEDLMPNEQGGKSGNRGNMQFGTESTDQNTSSQSLLLYGVCFIILLLGILFATVFRRKSIRK